MNTLLNRRNFIKTTSLATSASALGLFAGSSAANPSSVRERKIKLGLVGCGGRGSWIARLFQEHGGYEFHAVADYFPASADRVGEALSVDKARRFSTLSGYKRLIESGVEAVVLEVPPYFFPEQARAAVAAGLHVYMAKPVAADVPGCLTIQEAARLATSKHRSFLVDYQLPTDPANQEVRQRIQGEGLGKIAQVYTVGIGSGFADPPLKDTIEDRLRGLIWVNDIAMGCDYIGNYDIHAIDAALWALGRTPVAAMGVSRVSRPEPHGDAHDVCSVVYEYADGLVHNHFGQALKNQNKDAIACTIHGQKGFGVLNYWGTAEFRSFDDLFRAEVTNLYEAGASRNIDRFYRNITHGDFGNDTVSRAVDGVLTCILGRDAAARRVRLTMDQLLAENRRLEVDLKGLKA
ncbi:MAG: Gfo/Idh/MocA family oxidoreductase [Verrucomicrobia subdivision 3 bacterium]|nr:Gfo/Idh/MocA family oxidoreductase [Limisphaerales bacterium]